MITIGIELNGVIRNVNAQMLKYYQRDYHPELDIDEIDTLNEDVLNKYIQFDTKKELTNFLYIDYPYEIYGCAKNCDKKFAINFTSWLSTIPDYDKEEIRVILFSMGEHELSIQSSFFYLSKIGTRVREVLFPLDTQELWGTCDVVVAASNEILVAGKPEGKKLIGIARGYNKDSIGNADKTYESITDLMADEEFLDTITE